MMKIFRVSLLLFFCAALASAQTIPPVKAKSLNDADVTLPTPGSRQILILITGFSHKSGDLVKTWAKQISADYRSDSLVAYYQIPNLQGVPGFVKPMILKGMRKDTPPEEQSRFVPIYDDKDAWKKLVHFSMPDDPYLIVATPDGHPVWQAHGAFSDATYEELKKSVSTLLEKSAPATPRS
ncbi:MAG: hypothetical protein ACRD4Y_04360 [Candidatus Acidiferrales bacterium]